MVMMYHVCLLGVALSPLFRGPATRSPAIVAIAPPPSADQDGARGAADEAIYDINGAYEKVFSTRIIFLTYDGCKTHGRQGGGLQQHDPTWLFW